MRAGTGLLAPFLRARRADLVRLALWSAVEALPTLVSGWSVARAVGWFLAGRFLPGLAWLGLFLAAAGAGAAGIRQVYARVGAIVEPLRDELVSDAVAGAIGRSTAGSAPLSDTRSVARLTQQAEIVRDSVAGLLVTVSSFVLTMASTLIGLVTLVPQAFPYVIPPLVASGVLLRLLLRPTITRQRAALLAEEEVSGEISRVVPGVRDVTASGAEDRVLARLADTIDRQAAAARSAVRIGAARSLCLAVGGWLPLILVLAVAPSMVARGVSAGALIGIITYITGSLRASLYTAAHGMGAGLVRLYVTYGRLRETTGAASPKGGFAPFSNPPDGGLLAPQAPSGRPPAPRREASPPPVPPGGGQRQKPPPAANGASGAIILRDVRFAYGAGAAPVIDGLSLGIPAGDHLAVVGPSGIGKSSLAGLIAGTLVPDRGEVLLGGVPVAGCGRDWRVLLPQEAYVFAGTMEENLTYYRADGDRPGKAEMDKAAEETGLVPLLSRLGGYGAEVSPGALSAGQRQLIALTRAYLSPAPVAILDEATCYLDPGAERQAEEAFARRGGTLIVIAHRITSARRAKRILVLDGVRAQAGRHDELMGSSPLYRDLAGYWTGAPTP